MRNPGMKLLKFKLVGWQEIRERTDRHMTHQEYELITYETWMKGSNICSSLFLKNGRDCRYYMLEFI